MQVHELIKMASIHSPSGCRRNQTGRPWAAFR
jgi:hypothetical protein